jgi:hypothetical protein
MKTPFHVKVKAMHSAVIAARIGSNRTGSAARGPPNASE